MSTPKAVGRAADGGQNRNIGRLLLGANVVVVVMARALFEEAG